MRLATYRTILSSAVALSLAACGGGGGSGLNSTPTPTPTPTPPPTTSAVKIFPDINVSTDFTTIGLEASRQPSPTLTSGGFTVRYDASSGLYVMDFPSTPLPGGFYKYDANSPNATWWGGQLQDSSGGWISGVNVLKPSNPELQLTYTTLAGYDTSGMNPAPFGWVAFGTSTPSGSVPVTGGATYDALVRGSSINNNYSIAGTATLQFDFGAGSLAGHFDPVIYDLLQYGSNGLSLGRYDFVNTVYGVGNTSFSGQLHNSGVAGNGAFQGVFTGPGAEELMSRWQAPFIDPTTHKDSTIFGVWVGKH